MDSIYTMCTSTGAKRESFSLNLANLQAAMEALKVPESPIIVWMRQQGKPPEEYLLVLPDLLRLEFDGVFFLPEGTCFSKLLKGGEVIFVKRESVNLHLDTKYGPLELKGNL